MIHRQVNISFTTIISIIDRYIQMGVIWHISTYLHIYNYLQAWYVVLCQFAYKVAILSKAAATPTGPFAFIASSKSPNG